MKIIEGLLQKIIKKTTIQEIRPQKMRNMNLNRLLGKDKTIKIIIGITNFIFYYAINYLANFINNLPKIMSVIELGGPTKKYIGFWSGFFYFGNLWVIVFLFEVIFLLIFDLIIWYKFKVSYSEDYFNVGQKGKARWTTIDEIKQQYKEIPDRGNDVYEGQPGTIVAHFDGKIYIDTNINNTLIDGITRSGKDETYAIKSIDVYSRAEEKHSLIAVDTKIEMYKSAKNTLEKRGYDVYLLNLDDPLHSMGYNPLSVIIKMYKNNEKATAYAMARSFAYSIFHGSNDNKSEPIWANTATDLFTALIIAVITDELRLDEDLNEIRVQAYTTKVNEYKGMSEEEKKKCNKRIKSDLEKGVDPIEDIKLKGIPENYPYKNSKKHEKQINIFNIVVLFTELVRRKDDENPVISDLDKYFNRRDPMDLAKLKYATIESAGYRTKGSVYTNMLSYLGVFIDENIAKMTAESTLDLENIGFGEKPVAVFLGVPDYDKSPHFIVSTFIRQTYFVLAKKATNSKTQKCKIPVRFICNEFGQTPEVEAMDEMVTVCNGRNIGFDLYVQSYAQLYKVYGDNAQTIIDNCANEVYIKSTDPETLEKISKRLGISTFIDTQRNGEKLDLNKTYMETAIEKPLMRVDDLSNLLEGENIVMRSLKRKDNNGNNIVPHPIFNSVATGTQFLFRYQYLTDTFPNPGEIELREINTESREHIDLRKRLINVQEIFNGIDQQVCLKTEHTLFKECPNFNLVDEILRNNVGDDYMRYLEIKEHYTWSRVLSIIEESAYIKDSVKVGIRSAMST